MVIKPAAQMIQESATAAHYWPHFPGLFVHFGGHAKLRNPPSSLTVGSVKKFKLGGRNVAFVVVDESQDSGAKDFLTRNCFYFRQAFVDGLIPKMFPNSSSVVDWSRDCSAAQVFVSFSSNDNIILS